VYEIRLHGLGGEGVVTLSDIIGKTATRYGKWAHSFPFFGTEVRGAAVKAFTRVDDAPIHVKSYIYDPDVVIVTNDILLNVPETTAGLKKEGLLLVNTAKTSASVSNEGKWRVFAFDATRVAFDVIGKPIPNTVLFGAFIGATDLFPLASAEEIVREEFSSSIVEVNIKALRAGYDKVKGGM
jgi:2-oxoacid:acceptor oxidoreductase gamma subunit (pyruvate/2-ketoisovalerate family)